MSHECLHKRLGGQVGLVLETHCKKGLGLRSPGFGSPKIVVNTSIAVSFLIFCVICRMLIPICRVGRLMGGGLSVSDFFLSPVVKVISFLWIP